MKHIHTLLLILIAVAGAAGYQDAKKDLFDARLLVVGQPDFTATANCLNYETMLGHGYGSRQTIAKRGDRYMQQTQTYTTFFSPDYSPVRYTPKTRKYESMDTEGYRPWYEYVAAPALLARNSELRFQIAATAGETAGDAARGIKIRVMGGERAAESSGEKAPTVYLLTDPDRQNLIIRWEVMGLGGGQKCSLSNVSLKAPASLFSGFEAFVSGPVKPDARPPRRQRTAINKLKHTMMSDIEPGMPRQTFEKWFKAQVWPGARIKWDVNDCGEQSGTSADLGRDFPMCVQASTESLDMFIEATLQVGTFGRGVFRSAPVVRSIAIHSEGEGRFEVDRLTNFAAKYHDVQMR